ncbi:PD-(D/E)XK nuclease family protein [Tabrizicola sp.]|uniref:PD-(D/E)XK nuclease family protein n=1 Tax=Tabrizicola sp. TaxID=2005166 RepID=UPI0025FE9B83|nr:PD-(D/E)XK nuclease family protein [Tabrizicola sp.]MBY0352220.1 PD-(D/E)XK nuclease family protein [Tabrizicola sp.]
MDVQKLKDLVDGSGSEHLATVSRNMKVFCPFEAVGMARQEIRHSNFLAYILDPNRPHEFGTLLLEAFIAIFTDEVISETRLHRARIYRELYNVDLMVEIPPENGGKALVIAVEIKIDAGERREQLRDYQLRVKTAWRNSEVKFGFLTVDGREGTTSADKTWQPISWTGLIDALDRALESDGRSAIGYQMYAAYVSMMRRHGMADKNSNTLLDDAVFTLWSKHREALDYLFENRPDPISDLMRKISKNMGEMAELLSSSLGIPVKPASSTRSYLRFSFPGLEARYEDLCKGSKKWAGETASIILLEIYRNGDGISASIVVGPADGAPEFRKRLIGAMNRNDGGSRRAGASGWSHNWQTTLGEAALTEAGIPVGNWMLHFANQIAESLRSVMDRELPALLDQAIS